MLGGVTTGRPVVARVAFKPTSTIHMAQQSVRKDLSEIDFQLEKGRHDPCVAIRAGVALESRMAIEIANSVLQHQAEESTRMISSCFSRAIYCGRCVTEQESGLVCDTLQACALELIKPFHEAAGRLQGIVELVNAANVRCLVIDEWAITR